MNVADVITGKQAKARKTKIIATIGPASRNKKTISELIKSGVNVFRLNFSHGSHDEHFESLTMIREVASDLSSPVAVLQDLCGPKIRITPVDETKTALKEGALISLKFNHPGQSNISSNETIYVQAINPVTTLKPGERVYLADGAIELVAKEPAKNDAIVCTIKTDGALRSKIGIAFPDSNVTLAATTEKDFIDLKWGLKNEIDYVALSFVNSSSDVIGLREAMKNSAHKPGIISKIERKSALFNIQDIINSSDGIMVARGDLGLELPLEQVPLIQKELIELCNHAGIPVIVATQLLSTMVKNARPTRAEVTDVANAVMSGADAVMLSEESAIGDHPALCVEFLDHIARESERSFDFEEYRFRLRNADRESVPDAIAYAACAAAVKVSASAIVCCTQTGSSARLLAKYRPQQPLYGASGTPSARRKMSLYWGVNPIELKTASELRGEEVDASLKAVQQRENLPDGSLAVVTGGIAAGKPGSTSVIEIKEIGNS